MHVFIGLAYSCISNQYEVIELGKLERATNGRPMHTCETKLTNKWIMYVEPLKSTKDDPSTNGVWSVYLEKLTYESVFIKSNCMAEIYFSLATILCYEVRIQTKPINTCKDYI